MTQQVIIKTNYGEIVVTLDAATGTASANDFLRYISAGHWDPDFDTTVTITSGTIAITTWDDIFAKFAFQGSVATGQPVLDAITAEDAAQTAVIYGLEYVLPPEPAT